MSATLNGHGPKAGDKIVMCLTGAAAAPAAAANFDAVIVPADGHGAVNYHALGAALAADAQGAIRAVVVADAAPSTLAGDPLDGARAMAEHCWHDAVVTTADALAA